MVLRDGMQSIVIIYITYNNNNNLFTHSVTYWHTYLLTAVEFTLGGTSPYTTTDKTNKNKYVMLITKHKFYTLAAHYAELQISWHIAHIYMICIYLLQNSSYDM
jgi:hypothetical protein